MIAIETKYLSPTTYRGSRIKAFIHSNGFNITVPYDYSLSHEEVYFKAVKALIEKYNLNQNDWNISKMVFGGTKNGYVFCFPESIIEA